MSNLVVVALDEPHKAEEVRLKLQKLQSEYLLDLADVVVAVRDETGKVKLQHAGNLTAAGRALLSRPANETLGRGKGRARRRRIGRHEDGLNCDFLRREDWR